MTNSVKTFLEKLNLVLVFFFGRSWKTSISGYITIVATVIYAQPELVSFLPDPTEEAAKNISGIIALASGLIFARTTKDESKKDQTNEI